MADEQKNLSDTANAALLKTDPGPAANTNAPAAVSGGGGLSYATANADEKARMDKIIAGISLTDSKTIIDLGSQERKKLADLAETVLNSVQPGVKLAFANAMKELIDVVRANSLDEIKKRISSGAVQRAGKAFWNAIRGKDNKIEMNQEKINNFMKDVDSSRKTIHEMVDKLQEQQIKLEQNFQNINDLGKSITDAAQDMRIVRGAAAEYIRRVNDGEITTLNDLQKAAKENNRAADTEKLQEAQGNWNALRKVDSDLLASIGVYDMNVANLAFTKQANMNNRLDTATTLSTTVAEWKTQLAIFETVMIENQASALIKDAKTLTKNSIEQNKDVFETLMDNFAQGAASGNYDLRQIVATQGEMATKLENVAAQVDAQFATMATDKVALEKGIQEFNSRVSNVYKNGGAIAGTLPKPSAGGAPSI